ncbi:MAG: PIG-L family deacetylase [Acidobacteria bacterium]|nr:PIG-L family deacetylase [Acidobacteriota bacterium]
MEWKSPNCEVFVPDHVSDDLALARTTHLCIAAHPDDIEIMAYHGIQHCFRQSEAWFTGVTLTQGAKSPRGGPYAAKTDQEMAKIRRLEQKKAAFVGEYGAQVLMGYSSDQLKSGYEDIVQDLIQILTKSKPKTIYLHSPADKHETHVAAMAVAIQALRSCLPAYRPETVVGCEVWRDLDWLEEKVALEVSQAPHLAQALIAVFDSQISGGKRYDLATLGRRAANSVYHSAYQASHADALTWAIDLMPLIDDPALNILEFTLAKVDQFKRSISNRLARWS